LKASERSGTAATGGPEAAMEEEAVRATSAADG